jgi:hypothetical protein
MCLPGVDPLTLTVLTLAAQAGSAVVQHQGQKAQADYTDKANDIARKQFSIEEDTQRMDGERQRMQEYQEAASEVNAFQAEAMREQATLDALIGESGGGNTGTRQLATLGTRQGQDLATLSSNFTKRQAEMGFQQSAAIGSTRAKASTLRPGERPSMLGTGLTIAGATLQGGSRMNEINKRPAAGSK